MGVKRYQKLMEINENIPVLKENEPKLALFEHFLYHTVRVGIRGFRRGGSMGRDTCPGE